MTKLRFGAKLAVYIVLILGSVSMLVPFVWMLTTSFKQPSEVFSSTGDIQWLPKYWFWKDTLVNADKDATPLLCPADITDGAALIARIRDAKDPLGAHLFSMLPQGVQKAVRNYSGTGKKLPPAIQRTLVAGLNRIVDNDKPIYEKASFAQVALVDETKKMLDSKPTGDGAVTLNRMIIQDAFPGQIAQAEKIRAWWGNYPDAWKEINLLKLYLNSIFVAIVGTFGQVLTSAMAAYAFARLNFPGRDKFFFGYLATMMIPGSVTMIPVFVIMKSLGWINSYQALIIPGMFSASGTFLLRQFFMGLPSELEDAAKIDGCSYVGIWRQVIIPLSKPALATLTTFTFIGFWGSYMWPLIVTITEDLRTLPIGLKYFVGLHATNYTQLMAGSMIALIPVLVIFIFNQRYFVEGIKLSGMGGR